MRVRRRRLRRPLANLPRDILLNEDALSALATPYGIRVVAMMLGMCRTCLIPDALRAEHLLVHLLAPSLFLLAETAGAAAVRAGRLHGGHDEGALGILLIAFRGPQLRPSYHSGASHSAVVGDEPREERSETGQGGCHETVEDCELREDPSNCAGKGRVGGFELLVDIF